MMLLFTFRIEVFMQNRKKTIVGVIFVVMLLFTPIKAANADYWGASLIAGFVKQQLENAYDYIQGTLLGSLKIAAYQTISSQISSIISGNGLSSSAATQFITNWESFLYADVKNKVKITINDFYTTSLRGMASSSTYVSATGSTSTSSTTSWTGYLKKKAENTISDETKTYSLDKYCSDPSTMFSTSDARCFREYFKNPMNNPYGYALETQRVYAAELQKQQEIAKTQAVAYQGYKGVTDKSGNTLTPGSTVGQIQAAMNSHLLGLPLSAKNPAEIATMTASTFVNSLLQQALQQGMARVQSEVKSKINEGISSVTSQLGPAAEFIPVQRISSDLTNAASNTVYKWTLGTN